MLELQQLIPQEDISQHQELVVGRYAPSPTGRLHLGNLRTAFVAWLHSRKQGGRFLLRIEDVDTSRVVAGSAEQMIEDLCWLGLDWDDDISWQSQRFDIYQEILDKLSHHGLVYHCFCSRKDIRKATSDADIGGEIRYPGTCRNLSDQQVNENALNKQSSLRLRVENGIDLCCGDFVLRRADGLYAYQLAVVVDDILQGVNQVVRGADLLESTARQLYLAELLAPSQARIQYFHTELMCEPSGLKMSKRDGSYSLQQWRQENGEDPRLLIQYLLSGFGIETQGPISAGEALTELDKFDLSKMVQPWT